MPFLSPTKWEYDLFVPFAPLYIYHKNQPHSHYLYEYNIDRPLVDTGRYMGTSSLPDNGRIYAYIAKSSARASFKTVSTGAFDSDFVYGAMMTEAYPLTASITRRYIQSLGRLRRQRSACELLPLGRHLQQRDQ